MITNPTDILFSYHAPNDRTTPKYEAIRAAEKVLQDVFNAIGGGIAVNYGMVNGAVAAMHALLPRRDCRYLDAVELHVRSLEIQASASIALARNAANEAIATRQDVPRLLALARTEAQKARWAMWGIVAIVDAATHP